MNEKVAWVLTVVFSVAAFVVVLGPLWWWGLFGMSHDVGTAWSFTALILGPVFAVIAAASYDQT